jgi:transposase
MPHQKQGEKRQWRTRRDPFAEVWARICGELEADPAKEPTTLLRDLQRDFPGRFPDGQLRTLQRRVADWRRETGITTTLEQWTLRLLQGKIDENELQPLPEKNFAQEDVRLLLYCIRYRGIRSRNRSVAVLANLKGIPIPIICRILQAERKTVYSYFDRFQSMGASGLVDFRRNITKKADRGDYKDVFFSILHEPPSVYGINRTRWEMAHLKEVMAQKGFPISLANIRQIVRNAGYQFRKARKVLTSTDPDYREKLKKITDILSRLSADQRFFSVDEFGPFSVRIMGGRSLMPPGEHRTVPQYQKRKGTLILTAALELSTNQITHFYSTAKNTGEMIRLVDLLVQQYAGCRTVYFSWDAASWHASKALGEHVGEINALRASGKRCVPKVELAPLPASAQYLNVIESVFSGMARAVLHNSDYKSVDACKVAINAYFKERNDRFRETPCRAGNKIWGEERVVPKFRTSNNCKDPRWR